MIATQTLCNTFAPMSSLGHVRSPKNAFFTLNLHWKWCVFACLRCCWFPYVLRKMLDIYILFFFHICHSCHGPLTRYAKLLVAHAPGMFSPPLWVNDPDMHHGTCVTPVLWCMSGSLTAVSFEVGGGENVPGIPGACATQNFTYLARGPYHYDSNRIFYDLQGIWGKSSQLKTSHFNRFLYIATFIRI